MSDASSNASFGAGGSEDGEKREPVTYEPEYEANEDENIYENVHNTGIEFDNYFEIPSNVTGEGKLPHVKKFSEMNVNPKILDNIGKCKWIKPTPIQQNAIPNIINGKDIMACAQTGSGKTGAYAIPIIHKLIEDGCEADECEAPLVPECLVLAPTRELVQQIQKDFVKLCRGTSIACNYIVGGHAVKPQLERILGGTNVLVATPGRLNDFVGKNKIDLSSLKFLVLDEADRMLDMGFKGILDGMQDKLADKDERTTLMFSATFEAEVQELGKEMLKEDYLFIAIGIVGGACSTVAQTIICCEKKEKFDRLKEILEPAKENSERTLIFVETKRQTDYLASKLCQLEYPATSIHGDRDQRLREQALADFKSGQAPILIATNVAARGIDIPNVKHVVNYELPKEIGEYVHRIGRTGRCGNRGKATSFFDPESDVDSTVKPALVKILSDAQQEVPDFLQGDGGAVSAVQEVAAEDSDDGW